MSLDPKRVGLAAALSCSIAGIGLAAGRMEAPVSTEAALRTRVDAARATGGAPALGALVVRCGATPVVALTGVTRLGRHQSVTPDARFNIGSNAKSLLATLAATFVEDGRLRWDTTVADVLGPEIPDLDPVLGRATLAQLLSHRSGLPGYDTGSALNAVLVTGTTPTAQRLAFARQVLASAPAYQPGAKFLYSNAGYVVVGAMLEQLAGAPFDKLMRDRLFSPLGMTAAFGSPVPPASGQPWGHVVRNGVQEVYADPEPVIPAFLQPAGDVSLTLGAYGRYLREHLCGLEGKPTRVLRAATIQALHAPRGDDGAGMGWGRYELAGIPASVHVGGTGTFAAFVAVMPSRDVAIATVTNSGAEQARGAALALLQQLAREQPRPARP